VQWGRANDFLPKQLYETTNPLSLPLWTVGLSLCLFGASMKRYRTLGWMFIATFVLFLVSKGRSYYTGPSYVMLLAAGAVGFENWLVTRSAKIRRVGFGLLWGTQLLGCLIGIILIKPIAPINSPLWNITSHVNGEVVEMIGWQDLTKQVANIYQAIPENEKPRTAILVGNYGEAGALDLYGKEYNLPRIIGGGNSLWYRGYGNPEPQTVIVVGFEGSYAGNFFSSCKYSDTVTNSYHVQNEESSRHTSLYVCRGVRKPWNEMWQQMQWYQ
jgi:hypothetical protein